MNILIALVVGFLVGLIARLLMPGKQSLGIIMTSLLGIAGSIVGSLLSQALGMGASVGWIGSVIGAMLVLFLVGLVSNK